MAFEEDRFRARVEEALKKVETLLDLNKSPELPSDVSHRYDDKYLLAEFLTNVALASTVNVLERLGVGRETFAKLLAWSKSHSVSLVFRSEERCDFSRKEVRKEEGKVSVVTTVSTPIGLGGKITSKDVYKIEEYFWNFTVSHEIYAEKSGPGAPERLKILGMSFPSLCPEKSLMEVMKGVSNISLALYD
jgi:hypothetical protein